MVVEMIVQGISSVTGLGTAFIFCFVYVAAWGEVGRFQLGCAKDSGWRAYFTNVSSSENQHEPSGRTYHQIVCYVFYSAASYAKRRFMSALFDAERQRWSALCFQFLNHIHAIR